MTDEHGDFEYTLRQYLLMRRHSLGGEWTEIYRDVVYELAHHPAWDADEKDTYANWRTWYYSDQAVA